MSEDKKTRGFEPYNSDLETILKTAWCFYEGKKERLSS